MNYPFDWIYIQILIVGSKIRQVRSTHPVYKNVLILDNNWKCWI